MTLVLRGGVPSKKNSYRRSAGGGMHRPANVKALIDSLVLQARNQWQGKPPLEGALVRMGFVVKDGASDLDNKLTTMLDCLVTAGVLRNDSIKRVWCFSATAVINPDAEESVTVTLE